VFLEFQPGTDLDVAASDAREAVSRVSRRLPEGLEQLTVIKADPDSGSIINLAVYSESLLREDVTRIIERDIIPELVSIEGVADVSISGESERQLRVVVDPLRLASLGLSVSDVSAVLRDASFDVPAGSFRSEDQDLLVRADASVYTADQVAGIIVRGDTRVGDVAKVFFAPAEIERYTRFDGRQVISLGIIRKAQSNTIEISDGVHAAVSRLNQRYGDLSLAVTSDDAEFIRSRRCCSPCRLRC
jgi:multidrug efflux pump subunit AcrB